MPTSDEQRATQAVTAELDALIYAISHDLRAPVRALSGFTQALREQLHTDGVVLGADASHFVTRLEQSTQQLQQMMDGLLQLARLSRQALQLHAVCMYELCQQLISTWPQADQALVRNDIPATLSVDTDRELLGIALQALLDNARRFAQHNIQPVINLSAQHNHGLFTLCVADNGPGFDMRYAERLGTPFQTLHRDSCGLGLGLATVKRIVQRLGGELSIHSEPARGSRFLITLPCSS